MRECCTGTDDDDDDDEEFGIERIPKARRMIRKKQNIRRAPNNKLYDENKDDEFFLIGPPRLPLDAIVVPLLTLILAIRLVFVQHL